MKQQKDFTLIAFFTPIIIVTLFYFGFSCENKKDQKAQCTYEGAECPNAQKYSRDYQLELLSDSTEIWQGERLVATIHYSQNIDSVLLLDNQ